MPFTRSVWWSGWKSAASVPCATNPSAGSSQTRRRGPRGPRTPWRCDRRGTSLLRDRQALTHLKYSVKTLHYWSRRWKKSPKYISPADGGREGRWDFCGEAELMNSCCVLGHNVAFSKIDRCLVDSDKDIQIRHKKGGSELTNLGSIVSIWDALWSESEVRNSSDTQVWSLRFCVVICVYSCQFFAVWHSLFKSPESVLGGKGNS